MSSGSECSRLCRLINDFLGPYTERELLLLSKENEKHLLVSLSQVLREIQLWTRELDCDSDSEMAEKPVGNRKYLGCSMSHSEGLLCLNQIMAGLIYLLTVKNQFVQHLAGNLLGVISEFLAATGSDWHVFIRLLNVSMVLVISSMLSYSIAPPMTQFEDLNGGSPDFVVVLKPKLKYVNWSTVAGTIRIHRNILKYLKQECSNQLLEVYLESMNSSLSNIPWCLLDDIFNQNSDAKKISSVSPLKLRKMSVEEARIVFLGNYVQFLCSLVEQSSVSEASDGPQTKHPILIKIINLTPRLIHWCIGKQGKSVKRWMSQYFRHKLLVLMIRLSYQAHLESSVHLTWLQLLHTYFQELLHQPLNQVGSRQDDGLDGSPFVFSISDGKACGTNSPHLQRLAILLFLRCSLSLISLSGDNTNQCACATQNSSLASDSISACTCCHRNKGLSDLCNWIRQHLPVDMFVDHTVYVQKCISVALSFLQLFMHEDDLLFKVLLQLLSVPFCAEQQFFEETSNFQVSQQDVLFHFANIFNPIHLFHLFLSELHYDHQVLLDYLISKDVGISCAEYLLRCLRTVNNSWHLFVGLSMGNEVVEESSIKKRKVSSGGSNFQIDVPLNKILLSLKKKCKYDGEYDSKCCGAGQQFNEARNCLLSLKNSVENLHHKNLFPYNPEVLLKRVLRQKSSPLIGTDQSSLKMEVHEMDL